MAVAAILRESGKSFLGDIESIRKEKARQDKTRQDKTRQDKTRQDKTRQDKYLLHIFYHVFNCNKVDKQK